MLVVLGQISHTYIYIYICTHTHIYINICTHVHVSATHVDSQFFIHIHIHKRVCSFTHLSEGHGSLCANALCGVSGLCVGKLSQTPKGPCAHILDTLALNYLYRDYFKAHEYILYRHMDP